MRERCRRGSQRRLFEGGEEPLAPALHINDLPECLLLEVFRQLSTLAPVQTDEEEKMYQRKLPFRTFEYPGEVHPGLRAYPFLAQVCCHWKRVLESPVAVQALWTELIVDFGHELITGVHVPLSWSDVRPSDDEFREAFAAVKLRSHRLVEFVRQRRGVLRRLVLTNSEGYFAEDGEFVPISTKHNFTLGTLGILLGMLQERLQDLEILHCNDLFASGSPLGTIGLLSGLRRLVLDDIQCRLYREPLAELGHLTQLEHLTIASTQRQGVFIFGIDTIPDTWCHLTRLRSLDLRGNALLDELPDWMAEAMPQLELLDISACSRISMDNLSAFTQLKTLALQAMDLAQGSPPARLVEQAALHGTVARIRQMPDLACLAPGLRALNLADNNLGQVPDCVSKLTGLEVLDLSGNFFLEVPAPLNLLALTNLRWLDLRSVHVEQEGRFWSPAKCATMQNLSRLAQSLRRKNRHIRVLYDTS